MLSDQIAGEPSPVAAVRSELTDLERKARALIAQRPVVAVLAAFGAGYLVARLTSRVMR